MRKISTKKIEIGEHVLINGVEYVAKINKGRACEGCAFWSSLHCPIPCGEGGVMVKVEKKPINEQDKDTPMTYPQLAEWLAKGYGHAKCRGLRGYVSDLIFYEGNENEAVNDDILIRPWGNDEWVNPTVEIYKRDCR